jgi:hypothetical protein
MRRQFIAGTLLALLSTNALSSTTDVPILLAVRADVGDVYVEQMHLEVGILGVYAAGGIRPNIQIGLTEQLPCSDPDEVCGASRSVSHTYDRVDRLIAALEEALEHLSRKARYRSEIDLAPVPCESSNAFQGTVAVDPASMAIQVSLKSSNSISLNAEQAAGFLAHLNQANGILAHLKPRFDAFNATPPDDAIDVSLERSAYIQPLELFDD